TVGARARGMEDRRPPVVVPDEANAWEAVSMVPDGGDLYQVDPGAAKLDRGILLHYLDGFIDAGAAGRLLSPPPRGSRGPLGGGAIDAGPPRPPMTYDKDHWDSYDAPELAIHRVRDGAGKPFLMLTGPEPDHEWERFTSAVATVSSRLGAELVLGFHGIPMGVP